jgi:ribosomal protein S18 acetylase RimI-like enzyme
VPDPLLDNLRAFAQKVAGVLGGAVVAESCLGGFLSSDFDPFLNQLFASGSVTSGEVVKALAGRPGFVWLAEEPADIDDLAAVRLVFVVMSGMTSTAAPAFGAIGADGEIVFVRSPADLAGWYEVYSGVFGADARGHEDWYRVHEELGPAGDCSLSLLLAKVNGSPAATGAVFCERDVAGLYCFATREQLRGRGLASALLGASHAAVRARDIQLVVLQATDAGRPVYARAGYREARRLPVLLSRRGTTND